MAAHDDPETNASAPTVDASLPALPSALALEFVRQAPFLASPGGAEDCDPATTLAATTSAVAPWPHQLEVVRTAVARYPQGFLFCDEVGLGKTVEAGLALRSLWISRRARRILLLVPAALLRQWHEELHEKFALPAVRFDGTTFVDVSGRELAGPSDPPGHDGDNPWNRHGILLASSQLARRRERRRDLLAAEPWDLVVVDEAHHARRRDPAAEGFRPNRLLELLAGSVLARVDSHDSDDDGDDDSDDYGRDAGATGLVHRTRCLWLLTATPMQIHPAELWDLLSLAGAPIPSDVESPKRISGDDEPWRRQVFRHTRRVLRRYRREGLLDAGVPTRRPENVWIELGAEARSVYRRIENYLSLFYRRYEAERRGLGFVMTVYRRRLTSSFEAIRRSLLRRRERLAAGSLVQPGRGQVVDESDGWEGLDDSMSGTSGPDGGDRPGLFDAAAGADELVHLDSFLDELAKLDVDPKVEQLRADLRRLLAERDRAIVFTQYLDTLDHLREVLAGEWCVACWSGRGGEARDGDAWRECGKEDLKAAFGRGEIQVLLATDAASEGLNLQSCGVLINFDMPWNPMRAEQRIGRIDRIGQRYAEVWVRSYFYADTVEAEVYRRLADRIRWFEEVVGTLQPILQQVGQAVGEVAMLPPERRRRPLEERLLALGRSVEESRNAPSVALDSSAALDGGATIDPRSLEPALRAIEVERLLVAGAPDLFVPDDTDGVYRLRFEGAHRVTFRPEVYDAHPYSTRLLSWGEPLFDRLLDHVLDDLLQAEPGERNIDPRSGGWSTEEPGGVGVYRSERPAPVTLFLHAHGEARNLRELAALAESAPAAWRPAEEADAASRFSALRRRALLVREEIESERRTSERGELRTRAQRMLTRRALLELVEAENPGLFDEPLPWGFGIRAVREQARHGTPMAELVARLDETGHLPAAQPDDPFSVQARRHRRGWRERRRRAMLHQADDCLQRLRALDAAEAEARRRLDEPSAGMLGRRWFHLAPADDAGPRLLASVDVDPFVDAVPALGTLDEAARRILDAAEEGWDLLTEIRRHPEPESWLRVEGRAGARRFAAQVADDTMAPRVPEGAWVVLEMLAGRAPQFGELVLARVPGRARSSEAVLRRFQRQRRGTGLALEADAAGGTLVIEDPDPDSVQVLARFVGLVFPA